MEVFPVCTHCGFTFGEYRARGLLGCPHCYAGFGEALQGDIAWLHQALALADIDGPDAETAVPSGTPVFGSPADRPNAIGTGGPDSGLAGTATPSDPGIAVQATEASPPPKPDAETLARWREQIAAAVRVENYEEAARLTRLIRAFPSKDLGPGLGLA